MGNVASLEAEQDLINGYVRRWKERLCLGNWHIHPLVKTRKDWTYSSDAVTFMEGLAKVATIYFLSEADREPGKGVQYWHNNSELIVIHELLHILFFEYFANRIKDKDGFQEELFVNRLSLILYELENKEDPTVDPTKEPE